MTIIKSNLGEFHLLVTLNNREASKLLRVFIKNTLIFDYENTMQAGQLADLASLLTLFCKHKQTVSIGAVDNYTLFLISPDNIMAYVKDIAGLLPFLNIEGLVIENLESYGIAYEVTAEDAHLHNSNIYISRDLEEIYAVVEPANIPLPMATIKGILEQTSDVILGHDNIRTKLSEISAIEYPDFEGMNKAQRQAYIDKWNLIYPDDMIVPNGTLTADLLAAIMEKVGINE